MALSHDFLIAQLHRFVTANLRIGWKPIKLPHFFYILFQQASKHKKPTSKDSMEYYRRISCLSPYYDPETETEIKTSESNSPRHTTTDKSHPREMESSSGEDSVVKMFCKLKSSVQM